MAFLFKYEYRLVVRADGLKILSKAPNTTKEPWHRTAQYATTLQIGISLTSEIDDDAVLESQTLSLMLGSYSSLLYKLQY